MVRAKLSDRDVVVNILSKSFDTSPGINAIIKNDKKRLSRIKKLMEYSFDTSFLYGDIFLSEDKNACVIIRYPDTKKKILRSIWLLLWVTFYSIGFLRIKRVLQIEEMRKKIRPDSPISYIWFIGVEPKYQGKGLGGVLLNEVIEYSTNKGRHIYLETAILRNVPWYRKFGFTKYHEMDGDCKLHFMKREFQ